MKTEALYADVNARAFNTADWLYEHTSDYGDVLQGYDYDRKYPNGMPDLSEKSIIIPRYVTIVKGSFPSEECSDEPENKRVYMYFEPWAGGQITPHRCKYLVFPKSVTHIFYPWQIRAETVVFEGNCPDIQFDSSGWFGDVGRVLIKRGTTGWNIVDGHWICSTFPDGTVSYSMPVDYYG